MATRSEAAAVAPTKPTPYGIYQAAKYQAIISSAEK